jgi:hypothetical protein
MIICMTCHAHQHHFILLVLQEDCHIYLYPLSKVMITTSVFDEFDPWIPRMKVQLLYRQATPSYLTCLRGDESWGGGKFQEGMCFSCSLVQFDFFSFLFLQLIIQYIQTILISVLG